MLNVSTPKWAPYCRLASPNQQQITLRSGEPVLRAGFYFVGIPPAHQAMIQRYIIRIDRERRALVRGS